MWSVEWNGMECQVQESCKVTDVMSVMLVSWGQTLKRYIRVWLSKTNGQVSLAECEKFMKYAVDSQVMIT